MLAVLLILGIAGGAYALRREDSGAGTVTTSQRCTPAPSTSPAAPAAAPPVQAAAPLRLPAPGQVQLRLLNGTGRNGLARTVGDELARRGFKVAAMGNAPRPLAGASRVYFGPGGRPAATLVAAHVTGALVTPVPTAARGAVDVVLGSAFTRLRTPVEVSAYVRKPTAPAASPAAPAAPRPAASPSCR